ncbi:VOC family protein [Aestuariivita sp.]|jgi:predicted enzyme related to lactoylglutathione lyase|uniref:VOC family protein n=1 Tax=Aestuariivita sp. TaxID=1872407 RepID=UPI00216F67F2|nr:VOC family protein [Aestuariivita sp.]MCE8008012.1 glyoxalase [Aestuariivita sp.]
MTILRIVPNLAAADPDGLAAFYGSVFGLAPVMEAGVIVASAAPGEARVQMSFARAGGSGTPVPAVSIEEDDLEAALTRARGAGARISYGPVTEPWGVRRFFLQDPEHNLINVLSHIEEPT